MGRWMVSEASQEALVAVDFNVVGFVRYVWLGTQWPVVSAAAFLCVDGAKI